jgi:hypothetical protein
MAQAQTLHINGATFFVNTGATVHVNGDVKNASTSDWQNKGTVSVTDSFVNNQAMAAPTSGTTRFEGTAAQVVSGAQTFKTYDIVFDNANGVTLNTDLSIKHAAYFSNGIIDASSSGIYFEDGSSIANAPTNASHVIGRVFKYGIGSFTYPVGDANRYQPITVDLMINSNGMNVQYFASDAGSAPFTTNGSDATALVAYNAKEYWQILEDGALGRVTMYWDDYNNTGISNVADLKVAHQSNGEWVNEGKYSGGTLASGSVASNVINSWSPFTLGSISAASPLPITLSNFNVTKNEVANLISWQALTESNNDYFTIQKSADGVNFSNVVDVKSKAVNGNSNSLIAYIYEDAKPFMGANYYRLAQTDLNGVNKIASDIKLVNWNDGAQVSIYPNPVSDNLNISYNSASSKSIEMRLYDASGKLAALKNTKINKGINTISMDMQSFATGIYQLQIMDASGNSNIFKITRR